MDAFIFLVDSMEIANCLKGRAKRKRGETIMTDLFDPVFSHRETDEMGKSYQVFKLLNIEKLGIKYKVAQLAFGDYVYPMMRDDGSQYVKIIERKTMSDFIGSFAGSVKAGQGKKSKIRIDTQTDDCIKLGEEMYGDVEIELYIEDYYECRFDFTEENWGVWIQTWKNYSTKNTDRSGKPFYMSAGYSRRAIRPSSIFGKIREIEHKGVTVVKCGGAQDAYSRIIQDIVKTDESKARGIHAIRRKPKNMEISDNQVFLVEGLPGFGGGMAAKALEMYPRPIDLFNKLVEAADPKDINIPRLGKRQFLPSKKVLTENHAKLVEMEKEND